MKLLSGFVLAFAVFLFIQHPASADSAVIDNGDGGYSESGSWTTSGLAGHFGADSRYASSGSGSVKAHWTPDIAAAGNYDVYVWYPAYGNRATNAPYTVVFDGGSHTYYVDQTTNGSKWNKLGTHSFAAGTGGYVELNNDANGYVSADAVIFMDEGEVPPASKQLLPPLHIVPDYVFRQTLFDAEPSGTLQYLAFPSIYKVDDDRVIVSYKRGSAHYMDPYAPLETILYDPSTETVASRVTTDNTAAVINSPELLRMPDGSIVNLVQRQIGGSTNRVALRVFRSTDDGDTFTDEGDLPQIGSYEYGYAFDDVVDGSTVYVLLMSFPELTGGERTVHIVKTTDNGATWSYVKNIEDEFGYNFNESTFEKYGDGFIFVTRGDAANTTKVFRTDDSFNLIAARTWSADYSPDILQIGRPKLFVRDGQYYVLMRNIDTTVGPNVTHLQLYRIDPDTLLVETSAVISQNTKSAADSYYAEPYFMEEDGTTYFNVITYERWPSGSYPKIVRYELKWDELVLRMSENFNAMTAGLPPSGWSIHSAGGSVAVAPSELNPADHVLHLSDTSASQNVRAQRSFDATTGDIVLRYNVLAHQDDGVYGLSLTDAADVNGVTIAMDSTGEWYTYDGASKTVIGTYSPNQWYAVQVVARTSSQTFDVYINGELKASGLDYRNSVTSLSAIRINSSGAYEGSVYFDDILIH